MLAARGWAAGTESLGNTDGVLTWRLPALEPGKQARVVVIFAFGGSYDKAAALLERARQELAKLPAPVAAAPPKAGPATVWIKNNATDFALEPAGAFFWEGQRQSLTGPAGGQLSRFGYYLHYRDSGALRHAGTPITRKGTLENLRVVEPVHALSASQAVGVVETGDKRVRLRIRAMMGTAAAVGVELVLTNISRSPLHHVQLSAYSNLESAHDHNNDYSVLDLKTGGLLVVDPPTGVCVVMAGLRPPAFGYSGVWPSQAQLRSGAGVAIEKWRPFAGLPKDLPRRLYRASIPHPPARPVEPKEPATKTLTAAEADAALEKDWVFQAEGKPLADRAKQEIHWACRLAARLAETPNPPDLTAELRQLRVLERLLDALDRKKLDEETARETYFAVRRLKRGIMLKNPAVDFAQVLFIDQPYPQGAEWPHQARHRNGMMAVPGGRLLLLDELSPAGKLRKLAAHKPASFWRPDLSFDAKRVLFCCKPHDEKSFHLYEVNIDGTGLRQLTFGEYDDLDPIYLPDGHIMFVTTRANTYVRCMPYTYSYVLARCDSDGGNIYIVSRNNEPDWCPALLNDGRVVYSRWEYTDKALWRIQSLWTTNQDGAFTAAFWGNQSVWPDHLAEPRPMPHSQRVMFTGLAHHDWFAGSVGILDTRLGRNFPHGLTKVTADVPWPECGRPPIDPHEAEDYHSSGRFTAYKSPYPISEEDFLVSARIGPRGGKFKLYLMDVHGNRELIYEGAHNAWYAMPVKPRRRPASQPDLVAWPGTGRSRRPPGPGALYSADVYQGVPDVPRGKAKFLRVIQMDSRTYSSWRRDARFSGPGVSLIQDDGVKRILGTVPIEPDGSVHFSAPAGKALHFQLLDEHYRAVQTMRSFTGVMPGERRGCVGCHELHSSTPLNKTCTAIRRPAAALTRPPWGVRSVSYERMVQPVLDRHCGKCHQGDGKGRHKLDLTLRPGFRFFKEPYVTLVGDANYSRLKPRGRKGVAGAIMAENFAQSDPKSYATFRPMRHLSYTSKLIHIAMSREHNSVKVGGADLRALIAWVDASCPYRGDEEVREVPDPTFMGIAELPVRPRCKTAPIIARP